MLIDVKAVEVINNSAFLLIPKLFNPLITKRLQNSINNLKI